MSPAYGFFYALESSEDQEWQKIWCRVDAWRVAHLCMHCISNLFCFHKTSTSVLFGDGVMTKFEATCCKPNVLLLM